MVNISHDLRTPLAIARKVMPETLLLKKGQLSVEEEKEYGELVVSKMRLVEKMVGQLFELSKMESASFEMRREPFVFSEVLQEVVGAVAGDLTVDCQNCTDGSYVYADISMMERVVQNLVVNAKAYGRGQVMIGLSQVGGELVFSIGNEGEPLTRELLDWINVSGDGVSGDGARPKKPAIGLAIIKKILALHAYPFHAEVINEKFNVFTVILSIYSCDSSVITSLGN